MNHRIVELNYIINSLIRQLFEVRGVNGAIFQRALVAMLAAVGRALVRDFSGVLLSLLCSQPN
jgi:hypothetical protein